MPREGCVVVRRSDVDIQGCWAALSPDGEKDVGRESGTTPAASTLAQQYRYTTSGTQSVAIITLY